MTCNRGENEMEAVQPDAHDPVRSDVQPAVQPDVQGTGAGAALEPVQGAELDLTAEEREGMRLFNMYRARLHDVPDARIETVVLALRDGQSNRAVARSLIEDGYGCELSPISVRHYVAKIREALGIPGYEDPGKVASEDETDELLEGQPALKRLRWLARIQSARVKKTLKMEGLMGGMTLPMASHEIELMAKLIDRELEVSLKTGEMKQVPQKVEVTPPEGFETITPAEAYRVLLAYQKLMKMRDKIVKAADALPETE
jgi:hypothetical protein